MVIRLLLVGWGEGRMDGFVLVDSRWWDLVEFVGMIAEGDGAAVNEFYA
jgi:hypothetical protein